MKVITDEDFVAGRAKFARRVSLISLGILLLGLLASFLPQWYPPRFSGALPLVSFACLIVGFIGANIGAYNANRWVKEPRADQILAKLLRGFDHSHRLYNYVTPVAHVFVTPGGLFTLTVKRHDGHIRCEGSKWQRNFEWGRLLRFFGEEGLGNPTVEAHNEAEALQRFLTARWPDDGTVPTVQPVIVFTTPEAVLEVRDPAIPVVTGSDLKNHLRKSSKEGNLTAAQRKELADILDKREPRV
jgi:hypothetical protein